MGDGLERKSAVESKTKPYQTLTLLADVTSLARLDRRFHRSVALEAVLGVVVLIVTAVLVFLTPARSHPAMISSETKPNVVLNRR